MPIPSAMVGAALDPATHRVDARWTMAHAAALGDTHECYVDTTRPEGVVAHPLFSVCPEWPVIVSDREGSARWGVSAEETRQGVHATHDLTVHRLIRPGDVLTTTATCVGVEQRRPGAFVTLRLETTDGDGQPVATTEQGSLYLGVGVVGPDRPADSAAAEPAHRRDPGEVIAEISIPIAAGAAHVYSECARIWNPIHTDRAVAQAAGLPDLILHGTATLALGVSAVVDHIGGGDPRRVTRVCGRFGAFVLMPSTVVVRISEPEPLGVDPMVVPFEVRNETGGAAVDRGLVVLR